MRRFQFIVLSLFLLFSASCNSGKNSYPKQMSADEVLENMQGFWLLTAYEGKINEDLKLEGIAVEVDDNEIDLYSSFNADVEDAEIEFYDDNTFTYYNNEKTVEVEVSFKIEDGYDLMVWTSEGETAEFERTTKEAFLLYKGFFDRSAFKNGVKTQSIYLSENLTDYELSICIADINWSQLYYLYTDGSTEEMNASMLVFYSSDNSGIDMSGGETKGITWTVDGGNLYLTYPEDGTYYFPIDYVYDEATGYEFLYLYDLEVGYEGCAWIFYSYVDY